MVILSKLYELYWNNFRKPEKILFRKSFEFLTCIFKTEFKTKCPVVMLWGFLGFFQNLKTMTRSSGAFIQTWNLVHLLPYPYLKFFLVFIFRKNDHWRLLASKNYGITWIFRIYPRRPCFLMFSRSPVEASSLTFGVGHRIFSLW